jgi:hypothetical protein
VEGQRQRYSPDEIVPKWQNAGAMLNAVPDVAAVGSLLVTDAFEEAA